MPVRMSAVSMLACAMLAACAADGAATGSVTLAVREVMDAPSEILVPLPDGRLLVALDEGRLAVIDPRVPEAEPMVVGEAPALGTVHVAVPQGDAILVLADGGTFVLRGASWVPSPFGELLDGPITDAALVPTITGRGAGELWILTDETLYRVIEERAERFDVDADLRDARLAVTARPEGPALWLLLPDDRLLEIWRDRSGVVRTARLVLEILPTAIAGDAEGRGFAIIDGRLHTLGADRRLVDRGVLVSALLGAPSADELYALTADGAVFVHSGGTVYEADGATVRPSDRPVLSADGALLASLEGAVVRIAPRREVRVEGPADGSLLATRRVVSVIAEGEPVVEAELDGEAIDVTGREVAIDPAALTDGTHELFVRVAYDDGTLPTEERRRFEVVSNATWTEHVAPIYEAHCAACHGPEGPARTRLDTPERWNEGDLAVQILINVTEGRMPLNRPPLGPRDVALIEAWMQNDFAE